MRRRGEAMNYIRHLSGFFDRIVKDDRLGPLHISMYVSLFQFWNAGRFKNPISISRGELMRLSKISAKATYHKCMRELNDYGYIRYEPSFNPIKGSKVYLFNFETASEQVSESSHTKIETGREQVEEPYINNTNNSNSKHLKQQPHENTSSDFDRVGKQEKEKSSAKREREGFGVPDSIEEVKEYFEQESSTNIEAEKFYNHYQSNGWKVGGRSAMQDWQAAARNWILNVGKFSNSQKPSLLHTTQEKNYGEPL
jgi:hypothetical protein